MVLVLVFLCLPILSNAQCFVVEESSGTRKPCRLPFKLNEDISFSACTTYLDPDGKPWCSTKTDNGKHVGNKGHWGYCDLSNPSCQGDPTAKLAQEVSDTILNFFGINLERLGELEGTIADKQCPCSHFQRCPWTRTLLGQIKDLRSGHPVRTKVVNLMRSAICRTSTETVYCCQSTQDLDQNVQEEQDILSSGTWKPIGSIGDCGQRITAENIFGGTEARRGEFPYMALLGYLINGQIFYLCGGSVINARYILTAAHCHSKDRPVKQVVLGELEVGTNPDCDATGRFCAPPIQVFGVDEVVVHENWDKSKYKEGYDIALVRLDRPVTFVYTDAENSNVAPVCLPWNTTDPGHNLRSPQKATVSGWGRVTNDRTITNKNYLEFSVSERLLQKVEVPTVTPEECKAVYPLSNVNIQLCAGGEAGKDSCGGDSGGPLVIRKNSGDPWYQIGVVSFGPKQCGSGKTGVYTKIPAFVTWIASKLKP